MNDKPLFAPEEVPDNLRYLFEEVEVTCGAPWKRVTEQRRLKRERPNDFVKRTGEKGTGNSCANTVAGVEVQTAGWCPGCECFGEFVKKRVTAKRAKGKVSAGWAAGSDDYSPAGHQTAAGRAKVDLDGVSEEIETTVTEYISNLPLNEHPTKPCAILDPFAGSSTTNIVAIAHGRRSIGIELSETYLLENAIPRIEGALLAKPATVGLVPVKKSVAALGSGKLVQVKRG